MSPVISVGEFPSPTSVLSGTLISTTLTTVPLCLIVTASLLGTALQARSTPAAATASLATVLSMLFFVASLHSSTQYPFVSSGQLPTTSVHATIPRSLLARQPNVDPLPSVPPTTTAPPTSTTVPGSAPTDSPGADAGPVTSAPPTDNTPPTVPPSTTTALTPDGPTTSTLREVPDRDECAAGLIRMQAVLLLELIFEFLFLCLRCFADAQLLPSSPPDEYRDPAIDVTMRGYIFVRAIYLIFVLILNCSIYWIGGGPTGSCLSTYTEVQVAFAHLIMYVLYCIFVVVLGAYRIDSFDKAQASLDGYYDSTQSPYDTVDGSGPPTRTSSYFKYYSHRRRPDRVDSSGYEQPRFRVNLGCCALNFG